MARLDVPFLMMPTTPVSPRALGHHVGGAHLFVAQLRVGVQVAADSLQLGLESKDGFH